MLSTYQIKIFDLLLRWVKVLLASLQTFWLMENRLFIYMKMKQYTFSVWHLLNTPLRISAKMRPISAGINQHEFCWDMQGRGPTRHSMGPYWQLWLTWSTRSMRKHVQNNSITSNIPQTPAMSLCDSQDQSLRSIQWGVLILSYDEYRSQQ